MLLASSLAAFAAVAVTPVRLPDDLIRVGDVAIVVRGAELPILKLPAGMTTVTLDAATARTLVANRLPGARFALRGREPLRFVRGTIATGLVARPREVAEPIASGRMMTLRTHIGPVTIERRVVSLQPARPGKRAFVRTEDGMAVSAGLVAAGDQLYRGDRWAGVATDNRAQQVGDTVMVLISESASATNRVRNTSSKDTKLSGGLSVGGIDESGNFGLRGGYAGSGEVERTDRFVARMAAQVVATLPNGDFVVEGRQNLLINGERRDIAVRGQVRQVDISSDNAVASSRLANARIDYDGKGWVSRSAKPGIINQIFSFLGIG